MDSGAELRGVILTLPTCFSDHGYPLQGSWLASGALCGEPPGLERGGRERPASLSLDRIPQTHTPPGNEAACAGQAALYLVLSLPLTCCATSGKSLPLL